MADACGANSWSRCRPVSGRVELGGVVALGAGLRASKALELIVGHVERAVPLQVLTLGRKDARDGAVLAILHGFVPGLNGGVLSCRAAPAAHTAH